MTHTSRRSVLLQAAAWGGAFVGAGLLLVPLAMGLLLAWAAQGTRTSHLRDWPAFYRTEVSRHFKLPDEAHVVHAEEYHPFPMGQEVRVRFRLPATREPAEWVKHIANSSGIGDRFRRDPLLYDGPGDYNTVSYDPATRLYEVLYGWD